MMLQRKRSDAERGQLTSAAERVIENLASFKI